MSVFPEDVIADIISRLPVKPLLRFRCVSKSWCGLIDSPSFMKLHWDKTKKSKSHRKMICSEMYSVDFDAMTKTNIADVVVVPNPFGPVGIDNCCNGLVFLCKTDTNEFAIWNPATRRYQILHDLDSGPLPNTSLYSTKRRLFCGLGYDELGDDYKVVFAMQCDSDSEKPFSSEVNVYSLKSNSWKQVKPFPYYLTPGRFPGTAACGAVHCFVDKDKSSGGFGRWIAAFDLATEEYKILAKPKYPSDINYYIYLDSLDGRLSMSYAYLTSYIDIWVLKEYGNSEPWTKLTRIHSSALSGFAFGYVRSIEFSVTGKELFLQKGMDSMKRYDIEKKSAKDIEFRCQQNCRGVFSETYQESLVQLKNGYPSVPRKGVPTNKKIENPKKRASSWFFSELSYKLRAGYIMLYRLKYPT